MFNVYRLGFPNDEVRYGFMKNLLDGFAPTLYGAGVAASDFARDMLEGKVDEFMTRMRSILSGIPYSTVSSEEMVALRERDYQVSVYLIFSLMSWGNLCKPKYTIQWVVLIVLCIHVM